MSQGIPPGECLGPYEIKNVLGSGGLGVVYRARQQSLDRDIAIKVLAPALASDEDLVERFRREARTAAALHHPHIVTIYDTGCVDGRHYIAMELLAGRTLDRLPLPLDVPKAVAVAQQLCDALAYAHGQGVIHRDLKPENVLIDEAGRITLTDFGIARVVGQASLTLGGGPIGTPEFMSPEQARGEPAGSPSDVYSLGVLIYFLLTGISPFRSENVLATIYRQMNVPLPRLPDSTPVWLREWVERCAAKDPGARFPSGEEALVALREPVAPAPPVAQAGTPAPLVSGVARASATVDAAPLTSGAAQGSAPVDAAPGVPPASASVDAAPLTSGAALASAPVDAAPLTSGAAQTSAPVDAAPTDPLDAVLRGEMTLAQALVVHRERESEIRSAFQREVTALSLDVVRSTLLKQPGQTIMASFTFGAFRRFVQDALDHHRCAASVWSGDGLMALFPSADEAVGAAQQILEGLAQFIKAQSGLQEPVQVRIGLDSGRVLMTDSQKLGEVSSPTLDGAGRLQKTVAPDQLLMSEATWTQLTDRSPWQRQPRYPDDRSPSYGAPGALPVFGPRPPFESASDTMIQPGQLQPYRPGISTAANLPAPAPSPPQSLFPWAVILTIGSVLGMGVSSFSAFGIAFWVWAIIIAFRGARASRLANSNGALWRIAIILSLLAPAGLHGGGGDASAAAVLLGFGAVFGIATYGAVTGNTERRRLQRRGYVVLERSGAPGCELPEAARNRLQEGMAPVARRLGLKPRQLGLRLLPTLDGTRLVIYADAYNRDTGAEMAGEAVEGDSADAEGLAADLARRLSARLEQRSLPAPVGRTEDGGRSV